MLMFIRCYLVIRVIRDNSSVYINRHTILSSGYKDRGGPQFDSILILRMLFDKAAAVCLITLIIFFTLVLGWCNYVAERESPYLTEELTYFKALWATSYLLWSGDVKIPVTSDFGRFLELVTLVVGVTLYAMILAVIHSRVPNLE